MKRRALLGTVITLSLAGCTTLRGGSETDEGQYLDASGEIEIVVNDEPVDLSADRYQAEHVQNHSLAFHLHEFDEYWYMEGEERVTVAEAIDLLPHFAFDTDGDDHAVTIDGTTYDEADPGTEMTFLINGERVDPTTWELQDGDELRLEITTDA